ncbi:MAG: hypothetical protein WD024_06865 [Bacillota bacterium]
MSGLEGLLNGMESDLPKGMEPSRPATQGAPAQKGKPASLTLADGNYAAAIRQALGILPVEVRVDRFLVLEEDGMPPRVRLSLTILGEKEGYRDEREGA